MNGVFEPNLTKWLKHDVWDLECAICLLLGVNPDLEGMVNYMVQHSEKYREILSVAIAADGKSLLFEEKTIRKVPNLGLFSYRNVSPKIFINWAQYKDYEIPEPLIHLLDSAEGSRSNKSLNEQFPNMPERRDEWFEPIIEATYKYSKEHGKYPNKDQAWSYFWQNPPKNYSITAGEDYGKEKALSMGGNRLSKSAFKKRFNRWLGKTS